MKSSQSANATFGSKPLGRMCLVAIPFLIVLVPICVRVCDIFTMKLWEVFDLHLLPYKAKLDKNQNARYVQMNTLSQAGIILVR